MRPMRGCLMVSFILIAMIVAAWVLGNMLVNWMEPSSPPPPVQVP